MNDRPFSLQPRQTQRGGPQATGEFIQRANAEGGDGFRGLSLANLRHENSVQHNGGQATDSDHDVDMTGDASEADPEVVETKDIVAARDEILHAIHQTHQASMFALDSVSLLLSKENPAQAVTTFSPGLRDMVGIGTLGATVLETPTALAQSRVPDQKLVSIGKRLMDLNKAADTALAASKRFQQEIGLETKYWSEVLAVNESGWHAFRLPNEPHTMGVKFGFSNAAPEFKANSIAPMRRAANGSVKLEHGKMASGSKRLQVHILENDVVVGRSTLPPPLAADAPLQDRVRESRDTIFAQELWQVINREANSLHEYGVRSQKSVVSYDMDASRTVSLQLVDLGDEEAAAASYHGSHDAEANSLCTTLSLMLSSAHRATEQKRSTPRSAPKGAAPSYSVLTPLISYYQHNKAVQQCAKALAEYLAVLRAAGLPATVTMTETPFNPTSSFSSTVSPSTALATVLLKPPTVHFDITITPASASRLRILLNPIARSRAIYSVTCPPPPYPGPNVENPLATLNPPALTDYANLGSMLKYIYNCVPTALAAAYLRSINSNTANNKGSSNVAQSSKQREKWVMASSKKGVVHFLTGEYGVHFGFGPDPSTGQLRLTLTGDFVEEHPQNRQQGKYDEGAMDLDEEEDEADGQDEEERRKVHRVWTSPGDASEPVDEVARHVLLNGPRL
ncbi:RNA polymerase II mediator complex subunit [Collariella sp. IMI 366227]|nr:RNA polymerase II mediator complex subunit [Collariella sp. IMI 366227]